MEPTTRVSRAVGVAFGLGVGIHGLDHLRRGFDASPRAVRVIGSFQAAFGAARGRDRVAGPPAPASPHSSSASQACSSSRSGTSSADISDSFVTPLHAYVNAVSWASARLDIATAIVFSAAGIFATAHPSAPSRVAGRG